jgi:hypothetical protein
MKAVSITPNATLAVFDSTFDSISGPDADVRAIYAAIPGSSGPLTGTATFLIRERFHVRYLIFYLVYPVL